MSIIAICTLACVEIVGLFDNWRSRQTDERYRVGQAGSRGVSAGTPEAV